MRFFSHRDLSITAHATTDDDSSPDFLMDDEGTRRPMRNVV